MCSEEETDKVVYTECFILCVRDMYDEENGKIAGEIDR